MKLFQYILCTLALSVASPAFGQRIERANANSSYAVLCDTPTLLREYVQLVEEGVAPAEVAEAVSKKAKRPFACIVDHIAYVVVEGENHDRIVTKAAVYSVQRIVVIGVSRAGGYVRVPMRSGYAIFLVPALKA